MTKQKRLINPETLGVEMELEESLELGYVKISKIVKGIKYYSITDKGLKHLKDIYLMSFN